MGGNEDMLPRGEKPGEGKNELGETYFVLRVVPSGVQAAVGHGGEILSTGGFVKWSLEEEDEQLTKRVDEAIAQAVEGLGGEAERGGEKWPEPEKVLFGVPASWVHEHQLLPTHKSRLKAVARGLDLKPMGFVVASEALVRYLGTKQKFPFTGLIIEVGTYLLEVNWVRSGKSWEVSTGKREGGMAEDLLRVLKELPEAMSLPPRWWVFDAEEEVERIVKEISKVDWKSKGGLKVDHLPQVEGVRREECLVALAGVVGEQLAGVRSEEADGEEQGDKGVGEVEGEKGVAGGEGEAEELEGEGDQEGKWVEAEEAGFVWGGDENSAKFEVKSEKLQVKSQKEGMPKNGEQEGAMFVRQQAGGGGVGRMEGGVSVGKKGRFRLNISKKLLLLPLVLIIGLGLLALGYWYFPSAQVMLAVKSTALEEKMNLLVDPAAESLNVEEGIIPGRWVEVMAEVEKSKQVTGEKTVGEKAKGKVKIFNDTSSVQTLVSGMKLTSSGGWVFVLDGEVKVASKSVDLNATPPFKPGEVEAEVTAGEIGADYNLSSGTTFEVANFAQSALMARSDGDLEGGSAREVKAVSEDDINGLLEEAKGSLRESGEEELKSQVGDNEELVQESVQMSDLASEFDHEEGDEAENLNLKLSGKIEGVVFGKGDFEQWVDKVIEEKMPEGMELLGEREVTFEKTTRGEEGVEFEVLIKANLIGKIDVDEVKAKIRGRRLDAVKGYLSGLPGSPEVRLVLTPSLPEGLLRLPLREERISVEVVGKG